MAFRIMQQRLIEIVRERVANGELTESHLARLTGFSQPHIHNVLKGVKVLKLELADEILRQMRMKVADLTETIPAAAAECTTVPLLTGTLGPEMAEFWPQRTNRSVAVPERLAAGASVPLAVRLGNDLGMCPHYQAGDLVLVDLAVRLDRNCMRKAGREETCIVMTAYGPRLRYVFFTEGRLYCSDAKGMHQPSAWESFPIEETHTVVRARVVSLTRCLAADDSD